MTDLLTAQNLFLSRARAGGSAVDVLRGLSLSVRPGETVALIGASGTGKTTLAHVLAGLLRPSAGQVTYKGADVQALSQKQHRPLRCELQMIFQDPYSSLDPRQSVEAVLREALLFHPLSEAEKQGRIRATLHDMALPEDVLSRRAHEFSGGQRQRIAIARALVGQPALIIADEAVSALDVSVQARVLNTLLMQQQRTGLSLVFISHDMAVVRHMAHRVIVLDQGQVVEEGPAEQIFTAPRSDTARMLLQHSREKELS